MKYKHWGTVDEDNRFHPNATYFYAKLEDRQKLVFPSGWDLSEAAQPSPRWSIRIYRYTFVKKSD